MNAVEVGIGVCIGYGATNARFANVAGAEVANFRPEKTPHDPDEFFRQMGGWVVETAESGSRWLVAGFPGPVSEGGKVVGPLTNVRGMAEQEYRIEDELVKANPKVREVLDGGFKLLNVNDGELAAHAAAYVGKHKVARVAALIVGTGVGAGIVDKDHRYANVYRADKKQPYELGHWVVGINPHLIQGSPLETFETLYSGPGIEAHYSVDDASKLDADHVAWEVEGEGVAIMATGLGVQNGVNLVVPCGGVGAGATDKYGPHFERYMALYRRGQNGVQKRLAPKITLLESKVADEFEMYGAVGVMRAHKTEAGIYLPSLPIRRQELSRGFHDI